MHEVGNSLFSHGTLNLDPIPYISAVQRIVGKHSQKSMLQNVTRCNRTGIFVILHLLYIGTYSIFLLAFLIVWSYGLLEHRDYFQPQKSPWSGVVFELS